MFAADGPGTHREPWGLRPTRRAGGRGQECEGGPLRPGLAWPFVCRSGEPVDRRAQAVRKVRPMGFRCRATVHPRSPAGCIIDACVVNF